MNDTVITRTDPRIGQPVTTLDTPALLVDLDVVEANIARIAAECGKHGVNWRPHIKGNKTIEIVRKEIAAGAIGVTCAKVGEAEVMAEAGIKSMLIANQIVGAPKIARLVALQDRAEVIVCVDSVANAAPIAKAAHQAGKVVPVVIEVNVGMNRAGVTPGAGGAGAGERGRENAGDPASRADGMGKPCGFAEGSGREAPRGARGAGQADRVRR